MRVHIRMNGFTNDMKYFSFYNLILNKKLLKSI